MYESGLVVVPTNFRCQTLATVLTYAKRVVLNKIFLTLFQDSDNFAFWKHVTTTCYTMASEICPNLNVHVLLPTTLRPSCSLHFDVVLSREDLNRNVILQHARQLCASFDSDIVYVPKDYLLNNENNVHEQQLPNSPYCAPYAYACLGGTFDQIHNGHKLLLTIGALLASQKLLVGVTHSNLLANKQLSPLILSWEHRCNGVQTFLSNIGLPLNKVIIVGLNDNFGPPSVSPEFDCIVASEESFPNCETLNKIRTAKGFKPLAIETVNFINVSGDKSSGQTPLQSNELKLSSSLLRYNLLGTLLKPPNLSSYNLSTPNMPYVVGLVGPSCSGKSALAKRLANLSPRVHIIDCDRLGHESYNPGTKCYYNLIDRFGRESILSKEPPYMIDRSRLGNMVFSNPALLKELNNIVWPEIKLRIETIIKSLYEQNKSNDDTNNRLVVILDAAVLLQAGWNDMCHEVWMAILPKLEAQRRLCERNSLSPESANERLTQQATAVAEATGGISWFEPGQLGLDIGPVSAAHVILSTQWEPDCSQRQVEKAWGLLLQRI